MPNRPRRLRGYADLSALHENTRIDLICQQVLDGDTVGVTVDNHQDKIDRYCNKVKEKLPNVTVERVGLLTEGSYLIKFSIKQNN